MRLVSTCFAMLLWASIVKATTIPVCSDGTLAAYLSLSSCSFDGMTFSNFSYVGSASGGAVAIPTAGIGVTPETTQDFGLQFTAPWVVSGEQSIVSDIGYTVTTTGTIIGSYFGISGWGTSGAGSIFVTEDENGQIMQVNQLNPIAQLTGLSEQSVTVSKDISVAGNGGTAAVSVVENTWQLRPQPAPETSTLLLLGFGLVAIIGGKVFQWNGN